MLCIKCNVNECWMNGLYCYSCYTKERQQKAAIPKNTKNKEYEYHLTDISKRVVNGTTGKKKKAKAPIYPRLTHQKALEYTSFVYYEKRKQIQNRKKLNDYYCYSGGKKFLVSVDETNKIVYAMIQNKEKNDEIFRSIFCKAVFSEMSMK